LRQVYPTVPFVTFSVVQHWSWLRRVTSGVRACASSLGLTHAPGIRVGAMSSEWLQAHDVDSAKRQQ
jgi:hypothetical protein